MALVHKYKHYLCKFDKYKSALDNCNLDQLALQLGLVLAAFALEHLYCGGLYFGIVFGEIVIKFLKPLLQERSKCTIHFEESWYVAH